MTCVIKFDPRNGFVKDITGESGCANCGHPLENAYPPQNHLISTHGSHGDCLYPKVRGEGKCDCRNPQPKKRQTIRSKPIEVGTKVALWEMWRYMLKGQYCSGCWMQTGYLTLSGDYIPWEKCTCGKNEREGFPRHLLNTTIKECVPIEMAWDGIDEVLDVKYRCGEKLYSVISIQYNDPLPEIRDTFVKADTPNWTNKQFIDFFRKTYPDIEKRWVPFWIWKW